MQDALALVETLLQEEMCIEYRIGVGLTTLRPRFTVVSRLLFFLALMLTPTRVHFP